MLFLVLDEQLIGLSGARICRKHVRTSGSFAPARKVRGAILSSILIKCGLSACICAQGGDFTCGDGMSPTSGISFRNFATASVLVR
eukprot:421069-Rhodomonas_salina.2